MTLSSRAIRVNSAICGLGLWLVHLPAKAPKCCTENTALCSVLHNQPPRRTKSLTSLEEITEVLSSRAGFLVNCVAFLTLRRAVTYTHTPACILYLSTAPWRFRTPSSNHLCADSEQWNRTQILDLRSMFGSEYSKT